MTRSILLLVLAASTAFGAEPSSIEAQLALQSFRAGEKERLEKALGPVDELPLYMVELELDTEKSEVTGRVKVLVQAKKETLKELHLRATPNNIDRNRIKLSNCKVNGLAAVMEQPEATLYRVVLDPEVPPGAAVTVEVVLRAKIPAVEKKSMAQTGQAAMAKGSAAKTDHGAFGAFDDFISLVGIVPQVPPNENGHPVQGPAGIGDLALYAPSNFLASIRVPAGYRAHLTGAALGEVPDQDGHVRFSFAAAGSRDFPVMVSRGYELKTAKVDDITIESWFVKKDAEPAEKVLELARSSLVEFQKRLGPYPYKTFRVIEAPLQDGAGGMEFPGLITVATFLYEAQSNPSAAFGPYAAIMALSGMGGDMLSAMLDFTVAHEVAHQYFAGLVGSDPVLHPVVDESLAQFAALLYLEWRDGKAAYKTAREQQLVYPYHAYRMTGGKDAIADRATSEFESEMQYGAVVYGKAPLLHEAERKLMGDAAFAKAMRTYVDTYRYKWACADCFTQTLGKQTPMLASRLVKLRQRWWLEAKGDEDLGPPDMTKMMGPLGGAMQGMQGAQGLDAESLQMLQEALKALQGE